MRLSHPFLAAVAVLAVNCNVETTDSLAATFGKRVNELSQLFQSEPIRASNDSLARAIPIVGQSAAVRGSLYPAGDQDYYSFSATAGDRVSIAIMTSASAGSSTDSQLTLLRADAGIIEFDDDNGSLAALSSTIAGARLPDTDTYFLKVNDFTPGTTTERGYELHFKLQSGTPTPEAEPNDTAATANPLPSNGWVTGTRNPALATEQDWYALQLNAGDTVFLSLDLDPEGDAVSWNGRLGFGQLGDANNQVLVVDDANVAEMTQPARPSEALFVTVKDAGTYYAYVDSAGAANGGPTATYQLSVSVRPAGAVGVNCATYTSTDVPKAIGPGTSLVSSTITVPGPVRIGDLNVGIQLNHGLMQDVDVHLRSPAENDNGLFTDIGAAVAGGQTQLDVVFDDEAATPPFGTILKGLMLKPENNSTAGTASTSGAYRLSAFHGEDAGGTWTLDVRDDTANTSGGTLTGWFMEICEPAPIVCAGTTTSLLSASFESGDDGFTHEGAQDEWERGLPATLPTTTANPVASFTTCASGSSCWKTDLDNTYNASSNQNLLSPIIDLTDAGAPIVASWAMRHQLENANFDHFWVEVVEVDGGSTRLLYEWMGPTFISASAGTGNPQVNIGGSAGWGVHSANIDDFAGKLVRLRFHVDSDTTVQFGGLAIDDVGVTQCTVVCGDGLLAPGEQCDLGMSNGAAGSCCTSSCQFATGGVCRQAAHSCDLPETCSGSAATCPADELKPDGGACDDGTACTQTDSCQAGACVGGNPVTCTASDQCHAVGVCNPTTGTCSNPEQDAGTACDDGTACTRTDTCQAGACVGGNPVTCMASDQCHVVGVCNPMTGTCSNPERDAGSSCDDGNACTRTDSCQAGACVGGNAVTCTASDQCHAVGVCDAMTGVCSNPEQDAGTACDDGDSCTAVDTCRLGACVAGTNVCVDAGVDAGTTLDAGAPPDAGSGDAGQSVDAGAMADAGVVDAGTEADAGLQPSVDAGTGTGVEGKGCGCQGGGLSVLALGALLLWPRRRRRK